MKTEDINLFLEICKNKSINHTARILDCSQQGLSTVVKRLEDEVGTKLFTRNNLGVEITTTGKIFYECAKNIQRQMQILQRDIAVTENKNTQLKVAVSCGVLSSLPNTFWDSFKKNYPNIHIAIAEYDDMQCEQHILEEKEDIGFNIVPVDRSKFNSKIIVRNRMCALVHTSHPLAQKDEISICDLRDEKLLLLNSNFKLRQTFDELCKKENFTPAIELETMEMILLHNFSKQNRGIGIGVYFIGQDIPNVKAIPFSEKDSFWEVCVITKKNKRLPLEVRLFLDYVNSLQFCIL